MGAEGKNDKKLVVDVSAWCLNVSTSVAIIFVNKMLMQATGFKFAFATTLCGLHFLSCAVSIWISNVIGVTQSARIPFGDTLLFAVIGSFSIGSANLSLLVNSMGFYQIAKLMIVPFVCMVEMFGYGKRFTPPILASIVMVVIGVAIVVVTDVRAQLLGIVIAVIFVVTSGMQQIICGVLQRKHNVSSHQLLSNLAPVQGLMLLVVGPYVDHLVTKQWILHWEYNVPALECLFSSCAIAVVVNVSQYLCLGRFTATSFQVLGHTKTVLVLLGGWLWFGDVITSKQLSGMVLAVSGMILYGYLTSVQKVALPPSAPVAAAKVHIVTLPEKRVSGNGSKSGSTILRTPSTGGTKDMIDVLSSAEKGEWTKRSKEGKDDD